LCLLYTLTVKATNATLMIFNTCFIELEVNNLPESHSYLRLMFMLMRLSGLKVKVKVSPNG